MCLRFGKEIKEGVVWSKVDVEWSTSILRDRVFSIDSKLVNLK